MVSMKRFKELLGNDLSNDESQELLNQMYRLCRFVIKCYEDQGKEHFENFEYSCSEVPQETSQD